MKKLLIASMMLIAGIQVSAQNADLGIASAIMNTNPISVGQTAQLVVEVKNFGFTQITAGCALVTVSVPVGICSIVSLNTGASNSVWQVNFSGSLPASIQLRNLGGPLTANFGTLSYNIVLNIIGTANGGPLNIQANSSLAGNATQPGCSGLGNLSTANDNVTSSIRVGPATFNWTGATSTDWGDPTNWSSFVVPDPIDHAVIPNVPNKPTLTVNSTISNLNIDPAMYVDISGKTFTINGAVSGTGKLRGSSTSSLTISGAAGTLNCDQTSAATRSLNNLTLNSASSATLGNALDVYGTIALTTASLNLNGQNLILKSNAANTARIANLTGSTLSGAGNVTMERFIKLRAGGTGRAYRLLAPTVNTSGNIKANWMEGGMNILVGTNVDPVPTYGTQITGAGGNTNGFDVTANNAASLYSTTNAVIPTYTAIGSTTGTLNALTGYFLYVRGDRSMNMTLPLAPAMPTSSTTLRTKGTLLTGDQSFTAALLTGDGIMNLVTNPYASPISWAAVQGDVSNTNLKNYYTYWDANLGTRGGFVTVTNAGVVNPAPVGGVPAATVDIQPGQAFFVTSNGASAPTLTIKEAHKSTGNNNGVFLVPPESFSVNLFFNEPNNYRRIADGVSALYDNTYTPGLDGNDALEINNWDENIAIAREAKHLAIEGRPVILTRDTLPLFMNNMKQQAYEFEFTPAQFTNIGLKAELVDNFLNTRTQLSVVNAVTVNFTVTADPASSASNRFTVVFGPQAPLAIDAITIRAEAKTNGVQVNWTAKTEMDMDRYELERSFNGTSFSRINTTTAVGNSPVAVNYGWLDAHPQTGNNFYRIKAIDKSGQVKYTNMVNVNFGKTGPAITVYPNPVNGNDFNLQLTDMEKGIYSLAIFNKLGQMVYRTTINHAGGSTSVPVIPVNALAKGVYEVVLTGEKIRLTNRLTKN
jgi:Secretion system C-terminal sorting domain